MIIKSVEEHGILEKFAEDEATAVQALYDSEFYKVIMVPESDYGNTGKLRHLGIDVMYQIRTAFLDEKGKSWNPISSSLHSMYAHSWEIFETSSGPIVTFSEQSREHWNKYMVRFKSGCGACGRRHSIRENMHDILARMLQISNPLVVHRKRKVRCTVWGCLGHSARAKLHRGADSILGQDDSQITALYYSS